MTKYLLITSSGGSGHLQAAKTKRQEILEKEPGANVLTKDLLIDWLGKKVGAFLARRWNVAQSKGNVAALDFYSAAQPLVDAFFFLPIFFSALRTLLEEDIDQIIDTQPMGTKAILKAVRLVNYWQKKQIRVEKILTDFPTIYACHFFHSIKHLSKKDKSIFDLTTTHPLLTAELSTPDAFWTYTCKLKESDVHYKPLPIRPAFLKLQNQSKAPLNLAISTSSPEEMELIHSTLSRGPGKATRYRDILTYTIDPQDKVAVLMLGVRLDKSALFAYLKQCVKMINNSSSNAPFHLFIFCGHFNENSLQQEIKHLLNNIHPYPTNLSVIPLSYQEDGFIAPLIHRASAIITRSGGLTSMELLAAARGHIWIHQGQTRPPFLYRLLSPPTAGMPPWEKGNALYLSAKKGAHFISPSTFPAIAAPLFTD